MKFFKKTCAAICGLVLASSAQASVFTKTSPTGGVLPVGVTEVGGVVLDLQGTNGTRIVSQLSASSLFSGFATTNPQTIGTQTGFAALLASLGGGLSGASVRLTLLDGDSAPGNFDFNENVLLVDGISFGNFSDVATQYTSGDGLTVFSSGTGFGDSILSTGFFTLSGTTGLNSLYAALADDSLTFAVSDVDAGDNNFDFTQGVAGSLTNVGTGPTVSAVPEPATWAMMVLGFGIVGFGLRKRKAVNVSYA